MEIGAIKSALFPRARSTGQRSHEKEEVNDPLCRPYNISVKSSGVFCDGVSTGSIFIQAAQASLTQRGTKFAPSWLASSHSALAFGFRGKAVTAREQRWGATNKPTNRKPGNPCPQNNPVARALLTEGQQPTRNPPPFVGTGIWTGGCRILLLRSGKV